MALLRRTSLLIRKRTKRIKHINSSKILKPEKSSAQAADLRYVNDDKPGIRRLRKGAGFTYVDPDGKPVRDIEILQRIYALAIPPAWRDVWICSSANGHLQATGFDARGRKQYRYHPRWREVRDASKYDRMIAFGEALPKIRARITRDLARPGLPRRKVLATIVRLLETTLIRVGNEEYARENHSFGLTTLHNNHVKVNGSMVRFTFRGKSGVHRAVDLYDRRLARIIRQCQEIPGHELFHYIDDDGALRGISSTDVNEYLQEITGEQFTAKDFRTWAGTVYAVRALQQFKICTSLRQGKRNVVQAIGEVARRLGNTVAVCRKAYIHPAVIESYLAGKLLTAIPCVATNGAAPVLPDRAEEEAVLRFLRAQGKKGASAKAAREQTGAWWRREGLTVRCWGGIRHV